MKFLVYLLTVIMAFLMWGTLAASDDSGKNTLKGENVVEESRLLDRQYKSNALRMGRIIDRYDLLKNSEIRIIPYQVNYNTGKDFIEMEKHVIKRSSFDKTKIISVFKKNIKIYTNGHKVLKIETKIYKKNFRTGMYSRVTLIDPTPAEGGTDDIVITQVKNGETVINRKELKNFDNTTAFPVRNDIKKNFLIAHMEVFNDYLIFVGESYDGNTRKNDSDVNNFLKTAAKQ